MADGDEKHWVVVGAGSAGCVLASRLSEDSARRVTLLEAGPPLDAGSVPPEIAGSSFFDALGSEGRSYPDLMARRTPNHEPAVYQRGRGLGGSSAVNAMVGLRGEPALYESWGWTDVEQAWQEILVPTELPTIDELGPVDRALLAADPIAARVPLTRENGRRVTSAEAYLWPALDRSNLAVKCHATVQRVVIDRRRAVGVDLVDGTQIEADRVVMAAGAIHTPAILLRSRVDTPGVGDQLQEHPSVGLTLRLRDGVPQDPAGLPIATMSQNNGIQLLAMNHLGREEETAGLGVLLVGLMTPRGRSGRVSVPDLADAEPTVDFNLLADERDLMALARGVRRALEVLDQPAFREISDGVFIDSDGTSPAALVDEATVAAWLRRECADYVHATSSCAMGSVVDESGSLVDYEHLLVGDASVFPSIPDVNTHLPTTMLAERLSARWRANDG